ncbi:MAG: amidohydrolase [Rhodobacteraceae bacterium]|nr:MAG: amidohydrolase [Paracoccaceae bacterium]
MMTDMTPAARPDSVTQFEGADILTLDPAQPLIRKGAIAVSGNRILAVGPQAQLAKTYGTQARRIDWTGLLVLPGLVDGHSHLFQSLGRTLGDGLSLLPWLEHFMLPLAANVTPDDAIAIYRLAGLSALLLGTTAVIDNHYAPVDPDTIVALAREMEALGLRGVVARGIFGPMVEGGHRMNCDPRLFRHSTAEEIALTRACLAAHPPGGRVEIWPMPENVVYLDPELLIACAELAAKQDIGWQIHCSESSFEVEIFESLYGARPAIWMQAQGILSDRSALAHGIWFDDAEIEVLGATRTHIVHNPVCNQYLASGIVKLDPLLRAGANVCLGSDGMAVGGSGMFEAMKAGFLLQRLREYNPLATSAELMLEMATLRGAAVLRRDVGQLRAGMLADFVALDMRGAINQPMTRPAMAVVMAGLPTVSDVVVDGEVVIRAGRSTRVDHDKVIADGLQAAGALIERAGLRDLVRDWIPPAYAHPA